MGSFERESDCTWLHMMMYTATEVEKAEIISLHSSVYSNGYSLTRMLLLLSC